jgi:uncharacterized membrane protein YgdD (TMEM256/DUF423 family)
MKPHAWIITGAVLGALTVALGAFGAHALKDRLAPADLELWKTAVQYQGMHAMALVFFGLAQQARPRRCLAGWSFLLGTVVFSGTVYALALGGPRWLGAITPFGGMLLIVGWIAFAASAARAR